MQHGDALSANDMHVRERLLERRTVDPLTGCWEWQGRRDRWGYGRITIAHRRYSVHRLSAALFLGFDLSSPLQILHRCHNPPCFCPDHLRAGTHQENMRSADPAWWNSPQAPPLPPTGLDDPVEQLRGWLSDALYSDALLALGETPVIDL